MGLSSLTLCLATAATLTSAAAVPSTSNHEHVDISRRMSKYAGLSPAAAFISSVHDTVHKYGGSTSLSKRGSVTEEGLTDDGKDIEYYGNIAVGGQPFTVDFDTGSANLWVPGPGCKGCSGTARYNDKGKPLHQNETIRYGSGEVSGSEYTDTVSLQNLSATNVALLSVTKAAGFNKAPSSGLIGLGFSAIAEGHFPTFIDMLIQQGKLALPEFSFFLGRESSGTGPKSQLTIGGADGSLYSGSFTTVPVTKQGYWQVATTGVYVAGKPVSSAAQQAAIDTGTTIVMTTTQNVQAAAAKIPNAKTLNQEGETFLLYPCSQSVSFGLGFAGKEFAINAKDAVLGKTSSNAADTAEFLDLVHSEQNDDVVKEIRAASATYCVAAIAGTDLSETGLDYVVGDTFIKNWYTTFSRASPPSVKFAVATLNQ